jgi:uncharacterized protein (TIGR00369 family)
MDVNFFASYFTPAQIKCLLYDMCYLRNCENPSCCEKILINGKMFSELEIREGLRMKETLQQLFANCIEKGSEVDLNALAYVLEGFQQKIDKNHSQFVDGLLHMERKIDKEKKICEITVPLNPVWNNSLDIVHGGITATILDTAMGTAANAFLPEGQGAVTNQLNIHYIAPGIGDCLRCKAEIIHHGSKTFVVAGEVFRPDGKKIAYATGTFFIIQK